MLQDTLVISFWFVFASDYENRKFYFCAMHFISFNNREFLSVNLSKTLLGEKKGGRGWVIMTKSQKIVCHLYEMYCTTKTSTVKLQYF